MKFVRFLLENIQRVGVITKDNEHVVLLENFQDMNQCIANFDNDENMKRVAAAAVQGEKAQGQVFEASIAHLIFRLKEVQILAPLERPVHDILCVGVNYKAHFAECAQTMEMEKPQNAVYFSKRASALLGPDEQIEGHLELDSCLDYEVELAVIIGKGGRDIPAEFAYEHIFGYTVFNDISARTLQKSHGQWFRGKSLDTFSAMGPVIVHRSAFPFPPKLQLESRVNTELRQSANTKDLIRDIPTLIAQLSCGLTLEAGDIIATGTPAGVGMGFFPPKYLKSGDVVECEIEGIGILKNKVF